MQFISPYVQCCADSADGTDDKLRQRRCLQIRPILEFFRCEEKEKPCHLLEGQKNNTCHKEVNFTPAFELVIINNGKY